MGDVAGVLHPRRRLATRIAWRDRKEMGYYRHNKEHKSTAAIKF